MNKSQMFHMTFRTLTNNNLCVLQYLRTSHMI